MHNEYCESYPDKNVSYTYYYNMVKSLNISFVKLGEEECERCDLHEKHLEEVHNVEKKDIHVEVETDPNDSNKKTRKQTFANCSDCSDFEIHIMTTNEGRKQYRKEKEREWNADEIVVSVDLQKVMMLPRLPGNKTAIFCK